MRSNLEETVPLTGKRLKRSSSLTTVYAKYDNTHRYLLYILWAVFVLGFIAAVIVVFGFPPRDIPTYAPSSAPDGLLPDIPLTKKPTQTPTLQPTDFPTSLPTGVPTTREPTDSPTKKPTTVPTTRSPTDAPTTVSPTLTPTLQPTDPPVVPG